jgi:predicted porin
MKRCKLLLVALFWYAAQAAAQDSLRVYGVMDLGLVSDTDSGQRRIGIDSGEQTPSRIGFTGSEDLGGGMRASFLLESQLDADTGQPSFAGEAFGSQSWLSLSSPAGSIKVGRVFTPYFTAIAVNDPFDARGPGEATRLYADTGFRMNNTIEYSLPPGLGGWYADLAYGAGEVAGNASAGRQISVAAGYTAGPVNIELAHHDANDPSGAKLSRNSLIGGNINFGPLRLWLSTARNRNDSTLDTRDALAGVSIPVGVDRLALDYVRKTDKYYSDADARQWAMGYYHPLSLRTNLYLVGSRLSNGSNAMYQASQPGGTRRVIALGMRHQF